jgi:hypothetical protein
VVNALGVTSRLVRIWGVRKVPGIEYKVKNGTASVSVDIFVQEWEPALEPPVGFPRRRLLDFSVESSLDWAKQQLATCVLSHPSCGIGSSASSSGSFLPTRLINLSPLERDANIFLQDRETIQSGSPYVALSYSWGTGPRPACVTTAETLKANQQGIPWGALPATFRDTIHVARQLGISYLWIDSVCIIQDDEEEWVREGGTMFPRLPERLCDARRRGWPRQLRRLVDGPRRAEAADTGRKAAAARRIVAVVHTATSQRVLRLAEAGPSSLFSSLELPRKIGFASPSPFYGLRGGVPVFSIVRL